MIHNDKKYSIVVVARNLTEIQWKEIDEDDVLDEGENVAEETIAQIENMSDEEFREFFSDIKVMTVVEDATSDIIFEHS